MNKLDNKQLEMDLRMSLATISGYSPESYAIQLLITKAMEDITELVSRLNVPKQEALGALDRENRSLIDTNIGLQEMIIARVKTIEALKCCGNCGTTSKYIVCQSCVRYDGFTEGDLVDRWSGKEE